MKTKITCLVILLFLSFNIYGYEKREASIQWKPKDCTSKLVIPKEDYAVSQFGRGKYRIDNFEISRGHFNNIYMIFQSDKKFEYTPEKEGDITAFNLRGKIYPWRSYEATIEGRQVIRKEIMIPNLLPHEKEGSKSNYIWIRMDSFKEEYNDILSSVAEQIIIDALPNNGMQPNDHTLRR